MSASFSGLRLSPAKLFPKQRLDLGLALHVPAAPYWLDHLAAFQPQLSLRAHLGPPTSDEHRARRFEGLGGHAQAAIFECPVHADQVLFRLIGVFDAL